MDSLSARAVRVVEFVVTETGTYDTQFHRPWQVSADDDTVDSLYESINERKLSINNKLFTGVNRSIILPAGEADTKISIPGDWDEQRCRFIMTLEVVSSTGLRFFQVVRGFTDHFGVAVRGSDALFDEDMRFYVNSITTIKPRRVAGRIENVIEDVSHLLYTIQDEETSNYYDRRSHEERLRPEDLFTHMSRSVFDRELSDMNAIDETTINQPTPVKANASFSLPGTYASKVLSSFQQASRNTQFGATQADVLNEAINSSMETTVMNEVFLRALRNETRTSRAFFTLRNLARIDPQYKEPSFTPYSQSDRNTMHRAGRGSSWGATTTEAQAAVQIASGVPAIMARFGLVAADFSCQNLITRSFTRGEREWLNTPNGFMMATGMHVDHNEFLRMIDMVVDEVIDPLTHNGLIDIDVHIRCELMGDTTIDISLSGEPHELFVQPTFASALLSTMVTGRREHARQMASDFSALTNSLFELPFEPSEDIYMDDQQSPLLLEDGLRREPKFQNSGISGRFETKEDRASFTPSRDGDRDGFSIGGGSRGGRGSGI